jgi:TolA-binding protein
MTPTVRWGHTLAALLLALAPLFPGCQCPPSHPADFEDGVRLFLQGQYASAETHLRSYLRTSPSGAEAAQAHALLGSIALRRRDSVRAEEHFRACLRQSPSQAVAETAHIGLARCRFLRNEFRQCRAACRDFLTAHPDSPRADEAFFLLADATYHDGEPAEAQRIYRDVVSQFPKSPYAAQARARLGGARPVPPSTGGSFTVQVAALTSSTKAESHARTLRGRGFPASVVRLRSGGKTLYAVRVGPYTTRASADSAARRLKAQGFDGIVKP